ncbi:MAG: PQQ-binding-like beta-propeller repeat protein [Phycisphaerales bacterium]|nr:MAG: PQQ-binding-like beta-propeller repeat protein [Phycisphaerales bacterium]
MKAHIALHTLLTTALIATCLPGATPDARAQWPQWGGPNRNFMVESDLLADRWPEGGPRQIWKRELGDGYSSVTVDDGVLYTLFRRSTNDSHERVTALDAATGGTIWTYDIPSPPTAGPGEQWPFGPNATPLVVGDRLYATTANAKLLCLEKRTGRPCWQVDLGGTQTEPIPNSHGYSASPIAYKNTVVVPADRRRLGGQSNRSEEERAQSDSGENEANHTLAAFDQTSGNLVWIGGEFSMGHSSPILITFAGREQLVYFAKPGLMSFDPADGRLLWQHTMDLDMGCDAILTPVWNGQDLFYVATHNTKVGGHAIRLAGSDGRFAPETLWFKSRIHFGMTAPILIDNYLYGCSSRIVVGANFETGKRLCAKRAFEGGTCIYGGGKLIILDMNGKLGLATVTPEKIEVHSTCQVTERESLTPPTLAGSTLYLRDRKHILALDLSETAIAKR